MWRQVIWLNHCHPFTIISLETIWRFLLDKTTNPNFIFNLAIRAKMISCIYLLKRSDWVKKFRDPTLMRNTTRHFYSLLVVLYIQDCRVKIFLNYKNLFRTSALPTYCNIRDCNRNLGWTSSKTPNKNYVHDCHTWPCNNLLG